jgi:precorrin-6B methylase 2
MPGKRWHARRLRNETAYWRACILLTAAHLDLFAWIGGREKSPAALAAHFGGKTAGWEIFLNALCALGLVRKRGKKYAATAFAARYLGRCQAPFLLPEYDAWQDWGGLSTALRTGKRPKTQKPFLTDRNKAQRLLGALHLDAQQIAPFLINKLPLSRSRNLLDVGGGLGAYSIAFCRRYPRLQATVVEHPLIVPLARRAIREAGMVRRVRIVAADISRQALPRGFDTVLVSNVLHSRGSAENRSLLAKLHRCLNPQGQLILRDVFMRRGRTAPDWAALFSVLLLLQTPRGRCYALDEVLGWLRAAGFAHIKGPFPSSPLFFDPDSVLIAKKTR